MDNFEKKINNEFRNEKNSSKFLIINDFYFGDE